MTVNGKVYDPTRGVPPMTAFRSLLKDDELAAVLTFVRNTWGNKASPITAADRQKVREQTSDRSTFWKPEELLAEHPLEGVSDAVVEEFSNEALESELLNTPIAELASVAIERGNANEARMCSTNPPQLALDATHLRRASRDLAPI